MKHITDSERLTLAKLNRAETELKQEKEEKQKLIQQLKAMKEHITELKDSNKILVAQVRYLVEKKTKEWSIA